jgi:nicotinamidase/pyrazinamidase
MNKTLIIVDMQNDFMPEYSTRWGTIDKGALGVKDGLKIVPNIVKEAYSGYDLVVATRDFHPGNHCSFKELGGEWPMHCVAGSEGAQLLPEIDMVADIIVSKGTESFQEAYSGFQGTLLEEIIRTAPQVTEAVEVVICGVATDYCVEATAMDSKKIGFKTTVLLDCIAGVSQDTTEDALILMNEAGIELRSRA